MNTQRLVATAAGLIAGLGAAAAFRAVAIKTSPTIVVPDARIMDITPVLLDRWACRPTSGCALI